MQTLPRPLQAAALLLACAAPAQAKDYECLVEPRQVVELRAPVEALIEKIHVDRGDTVKKGQTLVEMDAALDRAKLELAKFKATLQGPVQAAQHRVEFSTSKSKRQQELFQDNCTSANDFEEAKTAAHLAESELVEAQDNKKLAQLEVRETEEVLHLKAIASPFNGVVMERLHHPGEVAQPDDRLPILKLAEIDPLYVEVVMPATAIGKIPLNATVEVLIDVISKTPFQAKVKVVDQVLDAASGTFGVRLELPNPERKIPAGLHCQARFKFED